MVKKYIRKSTPVEAVQMTKEVQLSQDTWPEWLKAAAQKDAEEVNSIFISPNYDPEEESTYALDIHVVNGKYAVLYDDWVVKASNGSLVLLQEEVFSSIYTEVV